MTSYCHRISAGASVSDRPIRLRRTTSRTVEISRFPRNNYYLNNQRPGIVLRSRLWVVEAVGLGGAWERSGGGDGEEKAVAPCSYAVEDLSEKSASVDRTVTVEVEEEEEENERCEKKSMDRTVKVMVAAAVTVVLGVGNRVLYKLALVPLKQYPFFLAQLATFGYFYRSLSH
jgi:hypothetical protein